VKATWTKTEALERSRAKGTVFRCRLQILKPYLPAKCDYCAWSVNLARTFCPSFARPGPAFGHSSRLVQALRGSVTSRGDAQRLAHRRGKHAYRSLAFARI
jgi:hypothetical protein